MKKKFLALLLTTALAVSVTACGSGDSASTSASTDTTAAADAGQAAQKEEAAKDAEEEKKEEAKPEVENPIEESLKRMADVDSMRMVMVMNMDLSMEANGESQAVESVTTMDMACITDPLKIQMEMTMDMGEAGNQSMSVYGAVDENGNYMMYMFDGTAWVAQQVGEVDLEAYNAQRSMAAQIGDTSGYVLEGTEKLNGAEVYKYSYTMTGDEMKESLSNAGALNSVSSLGLTENDVYGMLDGLGEMVTYVYVDAETYLPVQYEMDMTEIMNSLYAALLKAMGEKAEGISMSVSQMKMSMTCSDFNAVSDITIPAEALAAVPMAE